MTRFTKGTFDGLNGRIADLEKKLAQREAELAKEREMIHKFVDEMITLREAALGHDDTVKKIGEEYQGRLRASEDGKRELKRLLGDAYAQLARQDGYIARTLEDDAIREAGPTVEFKEQPTVPALRRSGIPPLIQSREIDDGVHDRSLSSSRRPPSRLWHDL